MKVVAFVPVKLHNQRLPGKNLRAFYNGKTPVQVLLETLIEITKIDEIYLFCSDVSIEEHLVGRSKLLLRSKFLDSDEVTPQDIISEFMEKVYADIYIVSHATSPFIKPQSIEQCIDAVVDGGYDSAFTAKKVQKLLWQDGVAMNFDVTNVPRTQDLPPLYTEVSAAYVFTRETFIETKRRIGVNPFIYDVSEIEAIDIDYPVDFEIADAVYEKIIKVGKQDD